MAAAGRQRLMIRRATVADAAEIAALIAPQGFDIDGVITLHQMTVLHRPQPVGRITSLGVRPGAQGKGHGRALVEAALAELKQLGCGSVEVTSHQRRKEAHAFYRHLGFEPTSFRFACDL